MKSVKPKIKQTIAIAINFKLKKVSKIKKVCLKNRYNFFFQEKNKIKEEHKTAEYWQRKKIIEKA